MYFKSILGQRFGKLTVIGEDGSGYRVCRCDCGSIKKMRPDGLRSGRVKTCGSCNRSVDRMTSVIGNRYGDLTVIEEHQICRNRHVMVRCECGNVVEKGLASLKRGQTKTCGCKKWYDHTHGSIYYMIDPITKEIRYIGQTVQQVGIRVSGHICNGPSRGRSKACVDKAAWIKSLKPLRPDVFVAERCVPVSQLDMIERQHIECQRSNGADLLNIHHNRTAVVNA
jgi:hypothetical protein